MADMEDALERVSQVETSPGPREGALGWRTWPSYMEGVGVGCAGKIHGPTTDRKVGQHGHCNEGNGRRIMAL